MMLAFLKKLLGSNDPTAPATNSPSVNFEVDHKGLVVSLGPSLRQRLITDPRVSQSSPRDVYVYAHLDSESKIFYVGRGSGRRAWSKDRDVHWHRYVDAHLHGKYSVQILADNLSAEDAEDLEGQWIAQENDGLVNLQNMSRGIDVQALDRRNALMDRAKKLLALARPLEAENLDEAIAQYMDAMKLVREYAVISFEKGLFGKLRAELEAENGPFGNITLLNRLTLCLIKARRVAEARACADEYFALFSRDRTLKVAEAIETRISRADAARQG